MLKTINIGDTLETFGTARFRESAVIIGLGWNYSDVIWGLADYKQDLNAAILGYFLCRGANVILAFLSQQSTSFSMAGR